MGGAENFAQVTRQAVTQIPQAGIKFLSCDAASLAFHAFEQQLRHLPRLHPRLFDRAADRE